MYIDKIREKSLENFGGEVLKRVRDCVRQKIEDASTSGESKCQAVIKFDDIRQLYSGPSYSVVGPSPYDEFSKLVDDYITRYEKHGFVVTANTFWLFDMDGNLVRRNGSTEQRIISW